MQHKQIHQWRAAVYQRFSQLLSRRLDEKQLTSLENGDSQVWIALLVAVPGISVEVKRFEHNLGRVLRRGSRQLELATDFASLFLLAPPASVSLCVGHYPHTTTAGERQQTNVLLIEQGLVAQENEPSDRITVQLASMARMIAKEERLSMQYHLLHHHILCWVPLFRSVCLMRDDEGFYPQAANLIMRFMQEGGQYLESLLMDGFYFSSQR